MRFLSIVSGFLLLHIPAPFLECRETAQNQFEESPAESRIKLGHKLVFFDHVG